LGQKQFTEPWPHRRAPATSQPPYSWEWNCAVQRCEGAAIFEIHASQTVEISQGSAWCTVWDPKCDENWS